MHNSSLLRNWRQNAPWPSGVLFHRIADAQVFKQPATHRFHKNAKFIAEPAGTTILTALKIGLLQLNSTVGDFAANRRKLLAGYEKACASGAEFVIAPELFLCGYPPRDLLLRADFIDANLAALAETAKNIGKVPFASATLTKLRPARTRAPEFRRCFTKRKNHLAHAQIVVADL